MEDGKGHTCVGVDCFVQLHLFFLYFFFLCIDLIYLLCVCSWYTIPFFVHVRIKIESIVPFFNLVFIIYCTSYNRYRVNYCIFILCFPFFYTLE